MESTSTGPRPRLFQASQRLIRRTQQRLVDRELTRPGQHERDHFGDLFRAGSTRTDLTSNSSLCVRATGITRAVPPDGAPLDAEPDDVRDDLRRHPDGP